MLERSKVILSNKRKVDLNKVSTSSATLADHALPSNNFGLTLDSIAIEVKEEKEKQKDDSTALLLKPQSGCDSVYFELDEFDFSSDDDDSYETDSNEYDEEDLIKSKETDFFGSRKKNSDVSPAPPKPKRTFEHDVYVHLKEDHRQMGETLSVNFNDARTFRNNQAKSMYNVSPMLNEHVYETLPPIRDINNNQPPNDTSQLTKFNNDYSHISNVNSSHKTYNKDSSLKKLRMSNLATNNNMVIKAWFFSKMHDDLFSKSTHSVSKSLDFLFCYDYHLIIRLKNCFNIL